MSRYFDADEAKRQLQKATMGQCDVMKVFLNTMYRIDKIPTADVRENVKATKVISGGSANSKGTTLWFVCSECKMPVDITDNFCKHCGADMRGDKS